MKKSFYTVFILLVQICLSCNQKEDVPSYVVKKLSSDISIDANWEKDTWQSIEPLAIMNFLGDEPSYKPLAEAKILYDDHNVYVIFRVKDRYVRALPRKPNEAVWKDSCVEFFFAPDEAHPLYYFNLEVNCGGVPLMKYTKVPRKDFISMEEEDFNNLEIAHSLPETVDPEIQDSITWTVEYRIPVTLLQKYSHVSSPASGTVWKANFFKIAEISSNPHYITWAEIKDKEVSFHKPEFFGKLLFE